MSDTPLSDVMVEHSDSRSEESYQRFLALFRASPIGVVGRGPVGRDAQGRIVTGKDFAAGKTTYGDGRERLLAFADPDVFLRNFGPRFNAGVPGEVLLRMAASDANCEGILVNCATQEISLLISKLTAQSLVSGSTIDT